MENCKYLDILNEYKTKGNQEFLNFQNLINFNSNIKNSDINLFFFDEP